MGFVRRGDNMIDSNITNRNGNRVQLASDPSDVRLQCSLEESIEELRQLDNAQLFPYISKLFAELERVLAPSPFV